jgi:hypothetical protein
MDPGNGEARASLYRVGRMLAGNRGQGLQK